MVAAYFADSQNMWACLPLIELPLIIRHSHFGGCHNNTRGFKEAVVAPKRALEIGYHNSQWSLKYQKLLLKNFSLSNLFAAN